MVARIQNLYLFLAGVLAAGSMFFPFWSFDAGKAYVISDFASFSTSGIPFVNGACFAAGIFSPLTTIISLAAIFFFKNRVLQSKLILLGILLFLADLFSGLTAAHFLNQYFQSIGTAVRIPLKQAFL